MTADFEIDGAAAGTNLAPKFRPQSDGVWELELSRPISQLERGRLSVSIRDRRGNTSRIVRTISVD